ncbi:hypothetical protein [Variovorax sp. PBL-E5]|uniref:hypothetical protein n=1 Tax=Variovorax sp. PBL-E5 TaxID=434014 RepID=UPI00131660FE|nr:hypothetical protein [Variovorax sp. PBL-E5]VTU36237.1 hypothetical protein E5CHR_04263 [Variovorax sp. PBL-E5]
MNDTKRHTPAQIRQRAQQWYDRQMDSIARAHGARWPDHKEWMESYLREELRQRLHALGWRPAA